MTEYDYDTDIAVQREEAYEDGLSKGLQQGISQGISQGIKQGISQGISQGIKQGAYEKAVETAKSMLADNLNIQFVAKYTNLPVETIQQLSEDLQPR